MRTNFAQFQMTHMADFAIADSSRLRWRPGPFIDAIITDRTCYGANRPKSSTTAVLKTSAHCVWAHVPRTAPYGVREGARQLATRSDSAPDSPA